MKQFLLFSTAIIFSLSALSQRAGAIIFSEAGERFTVFLNGVQQNETPSTNVKMSDLTSEFYMCKVVFEDQTRGEVTMKNFALQLGNETTYVVRANKKGQYVLRFFNSVPMAQDRPVVMEEPNVIIVEERPSEVPAERPTDRPSPSGRPGERPGTTTTTVQTTTTTTRPAEQQTETIQVKMDVPGVTIKMDVNETGGSVQMEETTVVTTTTTTTTTGRDERVRDDRNRPRPAPAKEEPVVLRNGCASSMPSGDFNKIKANVDSKTFSDSKMTVAKQAIRGKCPTAAQIRDFCRLFTFEADKLEFAKFAYEHAWDPENYYEVYDAFTFESSIQELNDHIEKR